MIRSFCLFLVGLLVASFTAGCDAQEPPPAQVGHISFLLDGELWEPQSDVWANVRDNGVVDIGVVWPAPANPMLEHVFVISIPDIEERTFPIACLPAGDGNSFTNYGLFLHEVNYDVLTSFHVPIDAAAQTGGFTITRYDSTAGEFEATFEATMADRNRGSRALRTLPDTFRISEGRLRVKVYRE